LGDQLVSELLHPNSWHWPAAYLLALVILFLLGSFAARVESWHQRRERQRATNAWADPERRIRFARQDFKFRGISHGRNQ
jgi:hypothetical protein